MIYSSGVSSLFDNVQCLSVYSTGGSNCTVVYEVVLGLLATIILTLFILLVTFTCLCCKQRKALKGKIDINNNCSCCFISYINIISHNKYYVIWLCILVFLHKR